MNLRILDSGYADLQRGKQFYNSQENGVGDYFLENLIEDIESLLTSAGTHRIVFGFHRLLSK